MLLYTVALHGAAIDFARSRTGMHLGRVVDRQVGICINTVRP
jgi:hypothetical protein